MERLEKLVNILKLTPHFQPELVKEATHRILTRSIRSDPSIGNLLKPLIEILIQYCDNDDSAQRSLFNDFLNSVILAFQYQHYQLILHILVEEITNNGSARTTTAALLRIPHLIQNVQPVELGYDAQKLLKALIEIARRTDDESVQKALDATLKYVMPYLDFHVRKSKEMQFLTNSLVDILLRNLQYESSQTRRTAASSIANICTNNALQLQNTLAKLKLQLELFSTDEGTLIETNKFVGFCLCVRELPQFTEQHQKAIINILIRRINLQTSDTTTIIAALETLRDLLNKFSIDPAIAIKCAQLISRKFLLTVKDGVETIKEDAKIILQSNALACISSIVKQQPTVFDLLTKLTLFKEHPDVAVRNQVISIIGNYLASSWKFPLCVEHSVDCESIRKLWVELRNILSDDDTHPDTLKSCVAAIKNCLNTLLESDHCLHIVEYEDFDRLIMLYKKSNFKPFRIEVLSMFSSLDYRTLHYLERHHWSKLRSQAVGSLIVGLQERVLNEIMISSLTDEHHRIRAAAGSALIEVVPHLYITNTNRSSRTTMQRPCDPIVSLANDLANEHLVVLDQADEHIGLLNDNDESINSEHHDKTSSSDSYKFLTSSIIQKHDIFDQDDNEDLPFNYHRRKNISINLMHVIGLIRAYLENSLDKGKIAISSIVKNLYDFSLRYPVSQYSSSWDCRASEYCDCFTLLNFLLTYLENLTEPDVVIEDLESYRIFLALSHQLIYALCHESVYSEYVQQRLKPYHKRVANTREGDWSELNLKHPCIEEILQVFFTHLFKLLWLLSYVIEEKSNPFAMASKTLSNQQQKVQQIQESPLGHENLTSNKFLFGRIHRKLEASYKSSKKNLNQQEEKFCQILETCLKGMSALFEFIGMSKSIEHVKETLSYLKVTSSICAVPSLICARQLLKSLFGINILAMYQVDPNDWFEEESTSLGVQSMSSMSSQETQCPASQGVYHHLVSNPYKVFSSYHSLNCSQIAPASDKALAALNFESRRALKVRRRIEERVKSLFETNPNQMMPPKVRQISEILKNTIAEFTPIVSDCMIQFNSRGFSRYQSEILHFMSYLILLRVNYQKLPLAGDLIISINRLLDNCGGRMYLAREFGMELFLRCSFTFLTLLTYERGPSKPMFQVAVVIQKLDDIRAKLSMASATEKDVTTYVVPLLRCLVEDLFIYRTEYFQSAFSSTTKSESLPNASGHLMRLEPLEQTKKDVFEILEAERETVAQKLLDVIDNPGVYDLLSILILESRRNSSEIKYKKLSQHLLSIIPDMLSKRSINLADYKRIELTRRIIENISPEVFQPVDFIIQTLLEVPKPVVADKQDASKLEKEFQRWMSLVMIAIHILTSQVKEEKFLSRIGERMSNKSFVEYLLHIAQLSIAEILIQLSTSSLGSKDANVVFLTQQLSSFILYITHMFQSGLFFQLSKTATDIVRKQIGEDHKIPKQFIKLCYWAREPNHGFSLKACEVMFYHVRLVYPDLTVLWCNVMMLLNNVDCNRDYWLNLLIYECQNCLIAHELTEPMEALKIAEDTVVDDLSMVNTKSPEESSFKRSIHINRPSSLNLSDVSFSDQLRRSFIKRIAATETRDKALNRNIIETSDEDGHLLEQEVSIGNTGQCLAPNIELARRGALCLVLDFVSISMNDVEHITWLIIHHINDIIRWSHEMPIAEFINAVHGNSASSGIFIQAINSNFNNFTSISFVSRLLWTLEQVHYTQYGSLVVLLVEKLLSSQQLMPYLSLTRKIEDFACEVVSRLLNESNKSLVSTNDEVVNQLTGDDLDKIIGILDADLHLKLTRVLVELRESTKDKMSAPKIELSKNGESSDEDSDNDDLEVLYEKAHLIYWLSEQGYTSHISTLLPALNRIKVYLSQPGVVDQVNKNEVLICYLVSSIYSLVLNELPPPTRLLKPKLWTLCENGNEISPIEEFQFGKPKSSGKPLISLGSKRSAVKSSLFKKTVPLSKTGRDKSELIEDVRSACLEALFLFNNMDYLQTTPFDCINELIIRLGRLPLINSFILTPPELWRHNIWPTTIISDDEYKVEFPMVTHDILTKDHTLLKDFCERLLKLGWISRRQFEEAWMTLLGVLSSALSQTAKQVDQSAFSGHDSERKTNLLTACQVISTLTRFLNLSRRAVPGDPLSSELNQMQNFDSRVIELTKSIGTNLSSLKQKTRPIIEAVALEKKSASISPETNRLVKYFSNSESHNNDFSYYLVIPAQKLRMSSILNVEMDMQDTIVIDSEQSFSKSDEIDIESCIRLLLSIYKQKLKDPDEDVCPTDQSQAEEQKSRPTNNRNCTNQLAPPLTTSICQSILALSDMFTDYEQFDWLLESSVQMFRSAERNDDELQMQYLIIGMCKAAAVCCYEIPNELTTVPMTNQWDVMFEKCRQAIERCLKSDFGPLKTSALHGCYYLLEDSINIVASGAWELDDFKRLRQSRLAWILRLMPIILDKENARLLTNKSQTMRLLELLCETVTETELKAIKI